ncbi:MAG: hypothetical protein ACE5J9_02505 [Methanosarcinales archaeon]
MSKRKSKSKDKTKKVKLSKFIDSTRLRRAKSIPDTSVHDIKISGSSGNYEISALIKGSSNHEYLVAIDENNKRILHDCPDWTGRQAHYRQFCKHVAKIMLTIPQDIADTLIGRINSSWTFETKKSISKDYKAKEYEHNAEKLLQQNKKKEAIANLIESAKIYNQNNKNKAKKIVEKALKISDDPIEIVHLCLDTIKISPKAVKKTLESVVDDFFEKLYKLEFFRALEEINLLVSASKYYTLTIMKKIRSTMLEEIEKLKSSDKEKIKKIPYIYGLMELGEQMNSYKSIDSGSVFDIWTEEDKNYAIEVLLETLKKKIIYFADKEEIELLIKYLDRFGCSKNQYKKLVNQYNKDYKKISRDLLNRKMSFLIYFIRKHKISINISVSMYRDLVRISRITNLDPKELLVLNFCGLEGKGNYITIEDYINNYPVFRELLGEDAEDIESDYTYYYYGDSGYVDSQKLILNLWGSLNPKIQPYHPKNIAHVEINTLPENCMIVEWDLNRGLERGSLVSAMHKGISIFPDPTSALSFEIQPLELVVCDSNPVMVSGSTQIHKPLQKINLKDAISAIKNGVPVICKYRPLDLLSSGDLEKIDKGIKKCEEYGFIEDLTPLRDSLENLKLKIEKKKKLEKFQELKKSDKLEKETALKLFREEFVKLQYLNKILPLEWKADDLLLSAFKVAEDYNSAIDYIHSKLKDKILEVFKKEDFKNPYDVKILQNTEFEYLIPIVVAGRISALKSAKIIEKNGKYDILDIKNTTYGYKLVKELKLSRKRYLSEEEFLELDRLLKMI